jgi:hypothetical protein
MGRGDLAKVRNARDRERKKKVRIQRAERQKFEARKAAKKR